MFVNDPILAIGDNPKHPFKVHIRNLINITLNNVVFGIRNM
jgi:hypothetical protein